MYLWRRLCTHVPRYVCGGQRRWSSPSAVCIPGKNSDCNAYWQEPLPTGSSCWSPAFLN